MGLLSDMKRLVFGAKSIAKSTAEKAAEAGKGLGEDILEKAEEAMDTVLEGFDVGRKAATEEWKATAIEAKEFANAKVAAREAQVDHAKESINGKLAELDEKSQRRLNW